MRDRLSRLGIPLVALTLTQVACATTAVQAPVMVATAKEDPAATEGHFGEAWEVSGTVIRQGSMSSFAGLRRSDLAIEASWLQMNSMQQTPLYAILDEGEAPLPALLEGGGTATVSCKAYRGGDRAGGVVLYPCEMVTLQTGTSPSERVTDPPNDILESFLQTELGALGEGYRLHRKATRKRRGLRIGLPVAIVGVVGFIALLTASGRYDVIK